MTCASRNHSLTAVARHRAAARQNGKEEAPASGRLEIGHLRQPAAAGGGATLVGQAVSPVKPAESRLCARKRVGQAELACPTPEGTALAKRGRRILRSRH